MFTSCFIDMKA